MLGKILSFGLGVGLIVGIQLFVLTVWTRGAPPDWGAALGIVTMLLASSLIFVAVKRQRDRDGGGIIRFWPAFGMGLAVSVVAGAVYVLAWELALAVTGIDFADDYSRMLIARAQREGASEEALAKLAADMRRFAQLYANPLIRMAMSFAEMFPLGALVALVSAGLLRNPRFLPR